jgi:uncharacterized protein (TIGR02145 family)
MKKIFFVFALTSTLISCKKETSSPTTSNGNNSVDTTNQTVTTPLISALDCSGAVITGTLKKGEVANSVSVKINYSGGNGKAYLAQSITSTSVTGLTAKLTAGTLVNGNGDVSYEISGTPVSAGTANFEIALGGKTCSIQLNIEEVIPTSGYGPTISDVDGNTYKTVYIGTQQWMAENLKVSKYSDGTTIPNITDNTQWSNLTTGAWAYYENDPTKNAKYGKLYNWYAVSPTTNGNKNVCPTGWHVPTDAEWTVLTDYLGGVSVAGGKMKEVGTKNWQSPNKYASDSLLFSALPGGSRSYFYGGFYDIGYYGYWWSSSEYNKDDSWFLSVDTYYSNINRNSYNKVNGFSVRCLKD